MGKGNRERLKKAHSEAGESNIFAKKKTKKQTPMWVWTLVTVLVVALILSGVVFSIIYDNGYIQRWTTVVDSENYKIDGAMLSYLYYNNYNAFVSTYGSYASLMGLDTSKSLKKQMMTDSNQTWFEYFMEYALDEAEKLVVYCNEADKRGIKLDDDDYAKIDSVIETIREGKSTYNQAYGTNISLDGYTGMLYGSGVKVKDVRRVLEMTQLATKCSKVVIEEIKNGITDSDIVAYYGENETDFLTASVLTYIFSAKAKGSDENYDYEAEKAEIDRKVAELLAATTEQGFKEYIARMTAEETFDSLYKKYSEEYDESLLPDEQALAAYKNSIVAQAVVDALAGKEVEETDSEDKIEKLFNKIAIELTHEVEDAVEDMLNEAFPYDDTTDAGKWISDSARVAGDKKSFTESDDDGYSVTVYYILEPMHRDELYARNVGHILFSADENGSTKVAREQAEKVLEEFLKGDVTKEAFETLGNKHTEDSNVFYYDVIKGQMVEAFEDWLFDPERKVGDTGIVETEYGCHIMYYLGESDMPAWKVQVKDTLADERSEELYNSLVESYGVKINKDAANKISA